ncbi:hypothetical protein GGF31_007215 [Allomyces arbusculus]|nr:hypothetical protein GGF31_007215 [Allomyces arbusculus]
MYPTTATNINVYLQAASTATAAIGAPAPLGVLAGPSSSAGLTTAIAANSSGVLDFVNNRNKRRRRRRTMTGDDDDDAPGGEAENEAPVQLSLLTRCLMHCDKKLGQT